ncbi:hypothetical protein BSL78_23908 [Apostichopus japonicus]|uniref:Uncharacterized protein n=1 Tax=Stichopus japonicus TaxID=307972 RepID=A0A2G8JU43_STIJA|nr:hypothetical protein BSL78_23908 [Apostichopus japonicus]
MIQLVKPFDVWVKVADYMAIRLKGNKGLSFMLNKALSILFSLDELRSGCAVGGRPRAFNKENEAESVPLDNNRLSAIKEISLAQHKLVEDQESSFQKEEDLVASRQRSCLSRSQCLTRDAEKRLKEAAEQKGDEKLLLQISSKDLIAIEEKASAEWQKRSSSGEIRDRIVSSKQKKTMRWKKFLANDTNKTELVEFLFEEWVTSDYANKLQGHKSLLCPSDGNMTTVQEDEYLCSTQEEADTRMLLHAAHASKEYDVVIIRSADTDVAALGVSHSHVIPAKLYLDICSKNQRHLLDLGEIATSFGELCKGNLTAGFHAFTGVPLSVSLWQRKKPRVLLCSRKMKESAATMSQLGSAQNVDNALLEACEKFVCKLYGSTIKASVNELRYEIFGKTRANSRSLPPNKDPLSLHVKRANYQAFTWRHALQPKSNVDDPGSHGWKIEGGSLKIKWMKLPPALKAILELMSANAKKTVQPTLVSHRRTRRGQIAPPPNFQNKKFGQKS